jgi:hypothetical protein
MYLRILTSFSLYFSNVFSQKYFLCVILLPWTALIKVFLFNDFEIVDLFDRIFSMEQWSLTSIPWNIKSSEKFFIELGIKDRVSFHPELKKITFEFKIQSHRIWLRYKKETYSCSRWRNGSYISNKVL